MRKIVNSTYISLDGVAEVWSAKATGTLTNAVITATPLRTGYDGLLTVVAFKNAAGTGHAGATGASTGAPDDLPARRAGRPVGRGPSATTGTAPPRARPRRARWSSSSGSTARPATRSGCSRRSPRARPPAS